VREVAAVALFDLCTYDEVNKDAIREAGGIAAIVRLLDDADEGVRTNAANVLGCLGD
jgi:HEAT repeat protein